MPRLRMMKNTMKNTPAAYPIGQDICISPLCALQLKHSISYDNPIRKYKEGRQGFRNDRRFKVISVF